MHIEPAALDDVEGLARMKWADAVARADTASDFASFVNDLRTWWLAHQSTHFAYVARDDGEIIGTAWIALVPRVPRPGEVQRQSADLQSVFVLPEHRGGGIGSALVEAACAHAVRDGATRITVHSRDLAVPVYQRLGFDTSPLLLQRSAEVGI